MATRGLFVFKHESALGNAPAHALFERIQIKRKDGVEVARDFMDYEVQVNETDMPPGVTLLRKV
jgi:CRISPR-associated protein Csd2